MECPWARLGSRRHWGTRTFSSQSVIFPSDDRISRNITLLWYHNFCAKSYVLHVNFMNSFFSSRQVSSFTWRWNILKNWYYLLFNDWDMTRKICEFFSLRHGHYFLVTVKLWMKIWPCRRRLPVCVRRCLWSSSERVNRLPQNNHVHTNGRSPVCHLATKGGNMKQIYHHHDRYSNINTVADAWWNSG